MNCAFINGKKCTALSEKRCTDCNFKKTIEELQAGRQAVIEQLKGKGLYEFYKEKYEEVFKEIEAEGAKIE